MTHTCCVTRHRLIVHPIQLSLTASSLSNCRLTARNALFGCCALLFSLTTTVDTHQTTSDSTTCSGRRRMFERIAHLTRHVLDSAAVDSAAVDPRCDLRRRHPLLQVAFGRFEQVCLRSILVFMNLLSIVFFNCTVQRLQRTQLPIWQEEAYVHRMEGNIAFVMCRCCRHEAPNHNHSIQANIK